MKPQTLETGLIPPQALDLEEAVIGAILLEREAMISVVSILKPDSFYKDSHRIVFNAARRLFDRMQPIDIITVIDELKKSGELDTVGGPFYVSQLTNRVASSGNIEFYARGIEERGIKRRLIYACQKTIVECYKEETDPFEVAVKHSSQIDGAGHVHLDSVNVTPGYRLEKAILQIEAGFKNNGVTGIPTGISKLESVLGGLQNGDLVVIGARPGHGKTALSLSIVHHAARNNFPSLFFQQEMSEVQIAMRELSMHSHIPMEDLRISKIQQSDFDKLNIARGDIDVLPVYIDPSVNQSTRTIRAKLQKYKRDYGIRLAVIDYLQLMHMDGYNKNETSESQISRTTRDLKLLAKEFDIPIVLLSQLNRGVESRTDKRPTMADLKGSGAIEADADVIVLLFNPGKYESDPRDENGNSLKNKMELMVEKNRMGRVGSVYVNWNQATNQFSNDETPF